MATNSNKILDEQVQAGDTLGTLRVQRIYKESHGGTLPFVSNEDVVIFDQNESSDCGGQGVHVIFRRYEEPGTSGHFYLSQFQKNEMCFDFNSVGELSVLTYLGQDGKSVKTFRKGDAEFSNQLGSISEMKNYAQRMFVTVDSVLKGRLSSRDLAKVKGESQKVLLCKDGQNSL